MSQSNRRGTRRVPCIRAAAFGPALVASFLVLAAVRPASAQAPDSAAVLRLGDVYRRVVATSPRVAAARAVIDAARARIPAVMRPPDPQLQLGWMNYELPNLAPMPLLGMVQLQLVQMLPLGGKLKLAGRVADEQASVTSERFNEVVWDLRSQTAMTYFDLYSADRSLSVARETLRLLQDVERTAQSLYRVGEGRQADVLRAQVEIARMAEDTLRMQAMREAMVGTLNSLLARPTETPISSVALPRFPDSLPDRSRLESVGIAERPMIRSGLAGARGADASLQLAKQQIWPDLEIGVQYAQQGGGMGTERMGSVMFGASIPVFARDRQFRMRDEATAMKRIAEADVASMRVETRAKIAEAYANLVRARNLSRLYRTTVLPQAEATVASAFAAYRAGTVDFMTLLDDRMTVNRYEQDLYTLDADQGKAWAELEMLIGRELFDANQAADAALRGNP
jgi:cobalt-zinc-cadmium efflux system outer membrane protein